MSRLIDVENLTLQFDTDEGRITAVDNVSFSLEAGEVMGHPRSDSPHFGEGVCVRFPGNEGNLSVWLANLSRTPPPPLPGGYAVGERVFYTGSTKTVSTGDKYTECQAGEVTGPATNATYVGKGVAVLFPGNKASINCRLAKLSRTEPSWASI